MVSPKFSLQNILDLRHEKVEVLEVELGKLLKIQRQLEAIMQTLEDMHHTLIYQLGEAQSGEIDLVQMNLLRLNILQLDKEIEENAQQIKQHHAAINKKRTELIHARQAEETLKILKQKQIEAYAAEQAQIEAQLQDDIYIARAFNRQQQGA